MSQRARFFVSIARYRVLDIARENLFALAAKTRIAPKILW